MEQKSPEWFAARLGKVTASRVADVMAKTKTGYSTNRDNYMMELLCQRLTGKAEESYTNAAMQRGTEMEPIARGCYEALEGVMVEECGLIDHPKIIGFGASPDGLIGKIGLLEIKCPNTKKHVEFLRTGKPDNKYQWQMTAQMACAGREWCDFVSFDDRLPKELQYAKTRFMRDDVRVSEMESEIKKFLSELNDLEKEMKLKITEAK
jgi:putative phage-type endonuclease